MNAVTFQRRPGSTPLSEQLMDLASTLERVDFVVVQPSELGELVADQGVYLGHVRTQLDGRPFVGVLLHGPRGAFTVVAEDVLSDDMIGGCVIRPIAWDGTAGVEK